MQYLGARRILHACQVRTGVILEGKNIWRTEAKGEKAPAQFVAPKVAFSVPVLASSMVCVVPLSYCALT
jgi:hypothetical protein